MQLSSLHWWVLVLFGVTALSLGLAFARRAGRGTEEYFLTGRSMPCWFLGCALVYSALFGTGFLLYGQTMTGIFNMVVAAVSGWGLFRVLPRVGFLS